MGAYTPFYASPELVSGEFPDPRDDVHALGVIWYQLLTGNLALMTLPSHWRQDLVDAGMPDGHVSVLTACIGRLADRPSDAGDLAQRLKNLLVSSAVPVATLAPPAPPVVKPAPRPRPSPAPERQQAPRRAGPQGNAVPWLVAVVLVLLVLTGAGLYLFFSRNRNPVAGPAKSTDETKKTPEKIPEKTAEKIPENILAAWKEAGAEIGWLRVTPPSLGFWSGSNTGVFVLEKDGKPGDLPAFRFQSWQEGRLAKLPAPAPAFGLSFQSFSKGTKMTDTGLKELVGLKSLQWLDLSHTKVTGAGLKELAGLKNLQSLNLSGTQCTDAGFKELAALKSLKSLNLGYNNDQVTGAGLKELAGLSLQSLDLFGARLTDAGLKELAGLKSLEWLNLGQIQMTDARLEDLAGLKSLQWLNLDNTQLTDAGLKAFARVKSLKSLHLSQTQVIGSITDAEPAA